MQVGVRVAYIPDSDVGQPYRYYGECHPGSQLGIIPPLYFSPVRRSGA